MVATLGQVNGPLSGKNNQCHEGPSDRGGSQVDARQLDMAIRSCPTVEWLRTITKPSTLRNTAKRGFIQTRPQTTDSPEVLDFWLIGLSHSSDTYPSQLIVWSLPAKMCQLNGRYRSAFLNETFTLNSCLLTHVDTGSIYQVNLPVPASLLDTF